MMTKPEIVLKFCPKCGSRYFNFEGERSFLCGKCGFHFFINSSAAVAAIIENDKGELLLTIRAFDPNKGMLDLPGGFVDPNESVEEALIREIKEELNLNVESFEYITSFPNEYVFSGYSVFTTDLGFYCKVSNWGEMHIKDDISGVVFVKKENINWELISANSIKDIIKSYWEMI